MEIDPILLAGVGGAGVLILLALLLKQKKGGGGGKAKSARGGNNKSGKGKAAARAKHEEPDVEEETNDAEAATEDDGEEWGWTSDAAAQAVDGTKVSVQDVDVLTEFNVYKQFGYFEKAAESLSLYLQNNPNKADSALVQELVGLWLEAKRVDDVSNALLAYNHLLNDDAVTDFVKRGLALDENHLGLRVLAESRLGWTVTQTAQEIGEQTGMPPPEKEPKDKKSIRGKKKLLEEEASAKALSRKLLVTGQAGLGTVSNEEKGAVLAFMDPEQSVRLLRGLLTYEASNKYLNKAIRASGRPAALLIDALTSDYRANNINGFAHHLWNLYYSLGQYGRQVKERMLGWGYNLGHHPVFESLESNPSDTAVLREIGIQQGFLDAGASVKKARHRPLVVENADVDAEPRTPAERALKEAEFLLMYGQLEQSMEMLENAIREYPQESQLYVALFDLYERAEEWERLEKLLQELRMQIQSLPEEVVLAMSQLLQRFNNGSFGQ